MTTVLAHHVFPVAGQDASHPVTARLLRERSLPGALRRLSTA